MFKWARSTTVSGTCLFDAIENAPESTQSRNVNGRETRDLVFKVNDFGVWLDDNGGGVDLPPMERLNLYVVQTFMKANTDVYIISLVAVGGGADGYKPLHDAVVQSMSFAVAQ